MSISRICPINPNLVGMLMMVALLTGCSSGDSPTEPGPPLADLSQTLETAHFTLRYDVRDSDKMEFYASALEGNYDRILEDLGLVALPTITGLFYPDQQSFTAATGFQALGSVQGQNQFSIVASPLQSASLPVHEFVHCASLHMNPNLGDNPVWVWEGVAVFEAEDFVTPDSVPCLVEGNFPSLADLESRDGGCTIYQVGYTLMETIVDQWGKEAVRDLIVNNGNVESALGISESDLLDRWKVFVKTNYL